MIRSPKLHTDDPDRSVECKCAVASEITALVARCVAAGWKRQEILMSIGDLVDTETVARAEFFRELVLRQMPLKAN
jgi:hypothetical protein